jgi:hypothetical protein
MVKVTADNYRDFEIQELGNFKIIICGASNRRGSQKQFNGKPNCSGQNINKHVYSGMTLSEYWATIKAHFSPADPQYDLNKHLKYDIQQGHFELHE